MENIALFLQTRFKFLIVFDNTVMHHRYFIVIAEMRMRIFIRRCAVSSPARMTYACISLCGLFKQKIAQVANLTLCFSDIYNTLGKHGNTCGIITAVFKAFKTVYKHGHSVLRTDIANYSTHLRNTSLIQQTFNKSRKALRLGFEELLVPSLYHNTHDRLRTRRTDKHSAVTRELRFKFFDLGFDSFV